jgi:rhomboid protease GluP
MDEPDRPTEPDVEEPGYVPPDPDEPPPVELWSAVGDVVPWGTAVLVFAWAAVFAWFALRDEFGERDVLIAWGASVTGAPALDASWRLLASTFLHAGPAHVFFNAASMVIFGSTVERLFARAGFWVVFAVGGAAASAASLAWRTVRHAPDVSLSIGASGAVFALGAAVLVAAVRLRHRLAIGRARALGAAILFLLAPGFVSGLARHGTDNAGHAGGLVAGLVLGALLPLHPRLGGRPPGRMLRVLATLAALAIAISFATAVRAGLQYAVGR